ncbi:MAG TPA: AAA family ATPase, partial [Kofleriaceae bacterium]|nr:AAA family ATPase [Kofleriaceae bacterium]
GRAEPSSAIPPPAPSYSLAHVATLFRRICAPLAYVHGRGVIHRDLSPANIFLIDADQPVLFDFGLAAQFRTDSARDMLEVGGLLRGTAHYMAPEQARGEIVDARADVYAVGCMLYEALTGRPPFLGESPLAVAMQHIDVAPEPPSRFAPALPAVFDDLVLRLLAKAPRDRIGYADDVAGALDRLGAAPSLAHDVALQPRAYTYRPGLAGRTGLVAAHDAFLTRLAAGTGGCAALIGESGVGKTRLAAEIAARALEHDIRVITGECEPIGVARDELRAAPLHPLRPLLRAIADRCSDDPAAAARLLGGSAGLLAVYEPSLAAFAPPIADHLEPAAVRFRVLGALRDALGEIAGEAPLLLVLDDLQWADELTIALLRSLGPEFLAGRGVFVLATARVEETTAELDDMLAALGTTRFTVPRLDRAAIGAMVRDMLALEDDAPTLTEFVAARAEGNPLFAAEYVRTAVDEGVLHRDAAGRWRLADRDADSLDELPTPGSVQSLIHRRLRSLSDPARELTLAAAVLGRSCAPDVLGAVAGIHDEPARTAIAELIQRHVVEDQPDGGLRFVHDKLREQAYAELPEPTRRALHRRAAIALEQHYRDGDLALHLSQLAQHWEIAGDLVRAGGYLERAADHALAGAAYGGARTLLRHLIELPLDVAPERRAGWERRLGEACFALGDLASCATHTQRSLERLGRPLPSSRLGLVAAIAGGVMRQLGSYLLGELRRPGEAEGDDRPRGAASPPLIEAALGAARMTSCHFFNADALGVMAAALSAANLAERAGADVPIAEIYSQLGYIAGLAGLRGIAHAYFERGRDIAVATHDPVGLGRVHYTVAAFHVGVGDWPAAREAAGASLLIARDLRNPQEAEIAYTILGHVDFTTGDYEASRRSAVALHDSARSRANAQHEAWGVYTQGRAALYLGELDAAIRDFERAMRMLAGHADHASHILCGGMLASALARAGEPARARAAADVTTRRIGSGRAPVFTITEGFVGAADAYLELARRGDRDAIRPARDAIANLARLARVFPIAAPAAATLRGVHQLRHGRRGVRRRAVRALRHGLALAERLAMPYDQAVAHSGLAHALGGDHAETARALFARLGCRWHLAHGLE